MTLVVAGASPVRHPNLLRYPTIGYDTKKYGDVSRLSNRGYVGAPEPSP